MMELSERYVFHIPLCKFKDNLLLPIDIDEVLEDLIMRMDHDSLYVTKAQGHYKSRSYDELLVTVFSSSDDLGGIFEDWFRANNIILEQDALAYEHNGKMYIQCL